MFDYRYDIHQPTRKLWVILYCIYMFMLISLCVAEVSQQTSSINQARRYPEDDIASSMTTESTNIDITAEEDEQARSLAADNDDFIVSVEVSSDGTQQQLDGINAYTQMSDHDLNMYAGKVMDELHRRGLIASAPAFDDSMFTRPTNAKTTDDSDDKERRKLTANDGADATDAEMSKYKDLDDEQLDALSQYHATKTLEIDDEGRRRIAVISLSRGNIALCQRCKWRAGKSECKTDNAECIDNLCRKDDFDCEKYTVAGRSFAAEINSATATGTDTATQVNTKTWYILVSNGEYVELNVNVGKKLDTAAQLRPGSTMGLNLGGVICRVYHDRDNFGAIMIQPTKTISGGEYQDEGPSFLIVHQN